jgi:hypothetical protein
MSNLLQGTSKFTKDLPKRLNSCSTKSFLWPALLLYIVLAGITVLCHEMWRDEFNPWLMVKASSSLADLLHNMRYEGHPPLWYLILYCISRVVDNPVWMQLCHLTIASSAAYILLRYAPFSNTHKLLLVLGYFFVYEYGVISRNYSIEMLLIFSFCAIYGSGGGRRYLSLSVILFLLCQTNAYGFIIAVSLGAMLLFELLTSRQTRSFVSGRKVTLVLCVCLVLLGMFISAAAIIPESGSAHSGWTTRIDLGHFQKTVRNIWRSFVPIPKLGEYSYWNTNILRGKTGPSYLSLVLIFFLVFSLARKPRILFLFLFGTVSMLSLQYLKFNGYLRHHGHLFILYISCLWLEANSEDHMEFKSPVLSKITDYCMKRKEKFLNILLGIHLAVGMFACSMDWFCPFSASKDTASYIVAQGLEELPILGDQDTAVSAMAGYLGRSIYYPRIGRAGSFLLFNQERMKNVDEATLLEEAEDLAKRKESFVLLLLNYKLTTVSDSIILIEDFSKSIVPDEVFYLYLVKHDEP